MGHGVDDVVHADANAESGETRGVSGIVGVLPGIAEIVVVGHDGNQPALVVIYAAKVAAGTARAVGAVEPVGGTLLADAMRLRVLHAGHLVAVIQVVDGVKNRILVGNVDDLAIGLDAPHTVDENVPLVVAGDI